VHKPSPEAESFRELEDGTIIVDRGPMLMSIFVSNGRIPKALWLKKEPKGIRGLRNTSQVSEVDHSEH
jgi:hypothetical protein